MGRAHRVALLAAFALLVAVLTITPISNNDIWLHLRTGNLILERGAVPRVEEYTFTRAGEPIVDHEWLAQVLFTAAHRLVGLAGLSEAKLALAVGTVFLVFLRCRRSIDGAAHGTPAGVGNDPHPATLHLAAAAWATLGAVLLIATHLFIRPHLFTFLLAAAFSMILPSTDSPDRRVQARAVAALLGLQILWVNLHGGFVVGILIASIHAVGEVLERPRRALSSIAIPVSLAAASLVNPYGYRIYRLVGEFTEPAFREHIVEWRSPFVHPFVTTPLFWVYILWLVAAGTAATWALRRGEIADPIGAAIFMGLSAFSRRHASLMGIITAPLVARALAAGAMRWREVRARAAGEGGRRESAGAVPVWTAVATTLALGALVGTVGLPWEKRVFRRPGFGMGENIPAEALHVIHTEGLSGRVFDTLAFGAFVTWSGWPKLETFIDSRLEVFGGPFLEDYERSIRTPEGFSEAERRYPFDLALLAWQFEPVAGAATALANDQTWALIYFDDLSMLWVKPSAARTALIERRAFRILHPLAFTTRGLPEGADPVLAEREARRAIEEVPILPGRPQVNGVAHSMLGAALHRLGRPREAAAEFRTAIDIHPDADAVYGMLGLALLESGDSEGAREAFAELKRRVPASSFADQMLREIESRKR